MTPDVRRRLAVIAREWQRIDPKYLDEEEQRYWATFAGRAVRFEERADIVKSFTDGRAGKEALDQFLFTCAAENPNRRLRMMALADRVSTTVDRAELRRSRHPRDAGAALGEGSSARRPHAAAGDRAGEARRTGPDPRPLDVALARATRKAQDRAASAEFAEAKRLLGALANSRGHRHEENAAKLVAAARQQPLRVAAALLASADGYTPRSTKLLDAAREDLGTVHDVAGALAENLPEPKPPRRSRRRRRRKKRSAGATPTPNGSDAPPAAQAETVQPEAATSPAEAS